MDKQIMEQLTEAVKNWVFAAEHQVLQSQTVYDGYLDSQAAMAFQCGVNLGINRMADTLLACVDQLLESKKESGGQTS